MSTFLSVTRPIRPIPAPVWKKQNRNNNNNNQLSDIEVFCLLAEAEIERVTHEFKLHDASKIAPYTVVLIIQNKQVSVVIVYCTP